MSGATARKLTIALRVGTALAAVLAIPALGQQRPESILPPGFGDPTPAPSPAAARPKPVQQAPAQPSQAATPPLAQTPAAASAGFSAPDATPTTVPSPRRHASRADRLCRLRARRHAIVRAPVAGARRCRGSA
ncbi:hypothetical protein [Sphingomonas sp. Ant H11]|uniref:hypothetical protein n=1 Tax=Sphingomonas sp. Ant H11 TaxID=1564113 RepID=UPI000AC2353C|nr:hypothetical protein [Sphingomonas sp. Ant H11]